MASRHAGQPQGIAENVRGQRRRNRSGAQEKKVGIPPKDTRVSELKRRGQHTEANRAPRAPVPLVRLPGVM